MFLLNSYILGGGFNNIGSQVGQQIPGEGDSGHFNNFKSQIGQDFGIIGNRKKRSPDPQFGNFGYQNPQFGNYGSQNPRFSNYGSQIGQQVDRSTNIDLGLDNILGGQTIDRVANHVDRILGRFLGRKKRSPNPPFGNFGSGFGQKFFKTLDLANTSFQTGQAYSDWKNRRE